MLESPKMHEFNIVGSSEVVLLLAMEEEAARLLSIASFSSAEVIYSIKIWKPSKVSGGPEWMLNKERTIAVFGVLKHLHSMKTFQTICKLFGSVLKSLNDFDKEDIILLVIEECNMLKIPLLSPLWDRDVVFQIGFRVITEDINRQALELPEGLEDRHQKENRCLLWAEATM